jgi:hypothetical protein
VVETTESPLLKVTVPMLKVAAIVRERETDAAFEARIASTANQLVGNYSSVEHRACAGQLHHGRINRIFELAGVKYQSWPEPIVHVPKKHKA